MSAVAESPVAPKYGADVHAGMSAADANRLFYADHAAAYDEVEHCAAKEAPRRFLADLLDRAIAASPSTTPRALDACGGTGNVSELLSRRGISTTLADISPEMLSIWEAKARRLGIESETFLGTIDDFLTTDERTWDLIVFSSALHHLDDYVGAIGLAAERLAPGGVLVTLHDPLKSGGVATARLRRFDYLLSLALDRRALKAALGRRSRRRAEGGVNVGEIAEKHVAQGVDDEAVIGRLGQAGVEILEHRRYVDGRYRVTESIMRALRLSTTFHLIARKPGPANASTATE